MLGAYGQSIHVDPELKLVMVHMGANATAEAGATSLGADRNAVCCSITASNRKR